MADIDSNQHGLHVVHGRWKLKMEQVALYLRVDLPEDVGRFAHVEGAPNASCDHLRRDLELVEELLVLWVVFLHP